MRFVYGFARFWYDFIIGDDWKIAASVAVALAATLAVLNLELVTGAAVTVVGAALLIVGFSVSLMIDTRRR